MVLAVTPRNPGLGVTGSQILSLGFCPGCPGYSTWPMGPCSCEDLKAGPAIPETPGVVTSPPWITPPAPQTQEQMTQPGAWTPEVLWGIQAQRAVDTMAGTGTAGAVVSPTAKQDWFSEYKWWLLGGVATLGVLSGVGGTRGTQAAGRGVRKAKRSTIASALPVLLVAGGGLLLLGGIGGGIGAAKFLSD